MITFGKTATLRQLVCGKCRRPIGICRGFEVGGVLRLYDVEGPEGVKSAEREPGDGRMLIACHPHCGASQPVKFATMERTFLRIVKQGREVIWIPADLKAR